tara:strand:- start:257 stop:934 length:678 start_codon:yes stop_codon:yes gene_type:complete
MTDYKYTKIKASAITFSDMKTIPMNNGNNRKQVYINYANGKFLIETPELYFPFGLYEDVDANKFSLTVSLGKEDDVECKKFGNLLEEINKLVKGECLDNSKTWLGKNYNETEIEVLYNNHVKKYKDRDTGEETGKYPDNFRVKLPYYDNKFDCKVYDKSNVREKLSDDDIKKKVSKGSRGKLLIQCNGVYFASGKFGVSWKLVQAKITPSANLTEYAFLSSDDDE